MFILKDNFTGDFLSTPAEAAQDTSGLTNAEWVEITPSNKEAVNAYLKSKGLPDVDNIGQGAVVNPNPSTTSVITKAEFYNKLSQEERISLRSVRKEDPLVEDFLELLDLTM
jgi:hypothetical protein